MLSLGAPACCLGNDGSLTIRDGGGVAVRDAKVFDKSSRKNACNDNKDAPPLLLLPQPWLCDDGGGTVRVERGWWRLVVLDDNVNASTPPQPMTNIAN